MIGLRSWIAILALTSASAGVGAGIVLSRWIYPAPEPAPSGAYPDYERLLTERFHLSSERQEVLRVVLENYRADIEGIKDRRMADYMVSIEPDLRKTGILYRDLIRDRVLPQSQRAEFDRQSLGLPATQTQH